VVGRGVFWGAKRCQANKQLHGRRAKIQLLQRRRLLYGCCFRCCCCQQQITGKMLPASTSTWAPLHLSSHSLGDLHDLPPANVPFPSYMVYISLGKSRVLCICQATLRPASSSKIKYKKKKRKKCQSVNGSLVLPTRFSRPREATLQALSSVTFVCFSMPKTRPVPAFWQELKCIFHQVTTS